MSVGQLEALAERERNAGHRDKFLDIKKRIKIQEQEELLQRHLKQYEQACQEFKIGLYIPELHASIKEIKHGCGTQRGWIDIYLSGSDNGISVHELRRRILQIQRERAAREYFDHLKFNDSHKLCIGKTYPKTLDMLIKAMDLDIPDSEEIEEYSIGYPSEIYDYILKQAKENGYTDEQSEEHAQAALDKEQEDNFKEYTDSVLRTVNYLLNFHGIELISQRRRYYLIAGWHEAANAVARTITGYGMFNFNSGKELKEGMPCRTYCEATIQHLHWLHYYPEVYGETHYRRIYER